MAGYTSRVLLTLSISSFIAVFGVLFYLQKRKSSLTRSLAVDCMLTGKGCQESPESTLYMDIKETQVQKYACSSTGAGKYSDMLLKEKVSNCAQTNAVTTNGCTDETPAESRVRENGASCNVEAAAKERMTNGTSHYVCDKQDQPSHTTVPVETNMDGASAAQVSGVSTDLVNGVKSVSLQDEVCKKSVTLNVNCKDFVPSSLLSKCNGTTHDLKVNGDLSSNGLQTHNGGEVSVSVSQNGLSLVSELSCETDFVPTESAVSTPDSRHSGGNESDSANSSLSEPSSECAAPEVVEALVVNAIAVGEDCGNSNNDLENGQIVPEDLVPAEPTVDIYEFEILQELCGLLIGRKGHFVKYIKEESNADILIKHHAVLSHMKTCSVKGTKEEINIALDIIRDRFPLNVYPEVTLEATNPLQAECTLPLVLKMPLPEGVTFDAILSSVVNPGHFFLQQPSHPAYHTMYAMLDTMTEWYSQYDAPKVLRVAPDMVVVVKYLGGWYRAIITEVFPEVQECIVRYLDFGGYVRLPFDELRQFRFEYSHVPFQAAECFLGNVTYPEGEDGWSEEAMCVFKELTQGQVIQTYIVEYEPRSEIPYVHLYKFRGGASVFINREFVNTGLARWIELSSQSA